MEFTSTQRNGEPGWILDITLGSIKTIRHVIPEGDSFVVVNPFDPFNQYIDIADSYDSAVEIAKNSLPKS